MGLSNSDEIRAVHNSFARQSVFEFDAKFAKEDDDVFHFVAYVPIKGRLYELDGLREGPLDHGAIPSGQHCIDTANENGAIELRMKITDEQELRKKWHKENVRRRHNYLPFIVELLKQLASNEQLIPVFEKAKAKSIELDKKKKEKKTGDK